MIGRAGEFGGQGYMIGQILEGTGNGPVVEYCKER